jgi:hypothetical protein
MFGKYDPRGGLGNMNTELFSPWVIHFIILAVSMILCLHTFFVNAGKTERFYHIMLTLTFIGISQATYFVGRAHPTNLLNTAIPIILILCLWIGHGLAKQNFVSHVMLFFAVLVSSILITQRFDDIKVRVLNNSLLNYSTIKKTTYNRKMVFSPFCPDWTCIGGSLKEQQEDLLAIVNRYEKKPEDKKVNFFIHLESIGILNSTGLHQSLSVGVWEQEAISVTRGLEILDRMNSDFKLNFGDFFVTSSSLFQEKNTIDGYYETNLKSLKFRSAAELLFKAMMGKLCTQFTCEIVEKTRFDWVVVSLKSKA